MPRAKKTISPQQSTSYRLHPWHGVSLGEEAPEIVNCYIEIVPTDTVKYELDKVTGVLKVDRPQKYSSLCPTLYGFVPQTYCGQKIAEFCMQKTGRKNIEGDGDPLDICIFTEKTIPRGDILLRACPVGGFRLVDRGQADDKIIAVMIEDYVYGNIKEISECPKDLIERLQHYFLTYKDSPTNKSRKVEITHIFNAEEARHIIKLSSQDYLDNFTSG